MIAYVPIPDFANNPQNDPTYPYECDGWIEFPWFDAGLKEAEKDIESVYIAGEFTATENVTVYWKDDDSTIWEELGTITAGGTELVWPDVTRPQTKRIKLGLLLESQTNTSTPVVEAVVLRYMTMARDKWQWFLPVRLADDLEMLDGSLEARTFTTQWTDIVNAVTGSAPIRYRDVDREWYKVKVLDAHRRIAKYEKYSTETPSFEMIAQLTILELENISGIVEEVQELDILTEDEVLVVGE